MGDPEHEQDRTGPVMVLWLHKTQLAAAERAGMVRHDPDGRMVLIEPPSLTGFDALWAAMVAGNEVRLLGALP